MSLPPYVTRTVISKRLKIIFPEGLPHRTYCVREAAAATVFTMLYIGAIEGSGQWAAPKQIIRMSDRQAGLKDETARRLYALDSLKPGFRPSGRSWYQENSREQIRDETIRQGFITHNAVSERTGIPTTSGKPRYALQTKFAALFHPTMTKEDLERAANAWREKFLSPSALARTVLLRRGAAATSDGVLVTFPSGETRRMEPGPSSTIAKAVIEGFATTFLKRPAVLWISESAIKTGIRDEHLASQLNIRIPADRHLPDIILIDLGDGDADSFIFVFIEVVASEGAVTAQRRQDLLKIAIEGGYRTQQVAFVTAYLDRSQAAFKRTVPELAWRSFVWFAAEPQMLMVLYEGGEKSVRTIGEWMPHTY